MAADRRNQPEPAPDASLPAPRVPAAPAYSTHDLELVIRRALELQAGSSATEDGLAENDIVRIGQELGLEPATVRRALAEVRSRPPVEEGALLRIAGTRTVRAARVVPRPAAHLESLLARYLRESELMVPQRRFPDRTRYVRDASMAAGIARFTRRFSQSHEPLGVPQLDVAVSALDGESSLAEITVDQAALRGGLVAGMLGSGGVLAGGWAAAVWASAIPDPLMLLGVPLLGGAWLGLRAIYRSISRSLQEKLESILDRIEHDELV